ncbi:MAG TPA: hypothetical protein VGX78_13495, partial [Pirellulales bacterium]|nr:hypothetical protein [Pirellulales bacterium]
MKPRNRAALGLGLALVTLILFAVLRRSCPMDPAPLREGDKHDSSELALSQDIPPRETTALVDGEEQAEPPLQVGQSGPEEEDRLKNAPGEPHDGPVADNSGSVDEATPEQIARLKDVLWWLPQDTETVGVAHGPFAFSFASKNQHVHNAASQFQRWVLPDIYVTDAERNGLDQVPVALVVKGSRCFRWESGGPLGVMVCGITTFEGCEIVVFKRPLDGAGDSSLAAVELRATKTELIEETTVAQVESDIGNQRLTSFIAHPAPEILIFANNRDYLAEVLA